LVQRVREETKNGDKPRSSPLFQWIYSILIAIDIVIVLLGSDVVKRVLFYAIIVRKKYLLDDIGEGILWK